MTQTVDKTGGRNYGVFRDNPNHQDGAIRYPVFLDLVSPNTELPDVARVHALYYFYLIAHRELVRITKDVNYEIEGITEQSELAKRGIAKKFTQLSHMACRLYGVTRDEMFAKPLTAGLGAVLARRGQVVDSLITGWVESNGGYHWQPQQGSYWEGNE